MSTLKRLFGEEFKNLLLLNLAVTALFLPIITAGPAIVALNGVLVQILDNRCDRSRMRAFWALFKAKFVQGLLAELLFAAYALVIAWCLSLAGTLTQGAELLVVVTLIAGFLAAIVSVCLFSVLGCVQMKFTQALWNAISLALARLPRSVLSAVCVYGMIYIFFLIFPASILPYGVLAISATAVVSLAILWPALDELILSRCTDESN